MKTEKVSATLLMHAKSSGEDFTIGYHEPTLHDLVLFFKKKATAKVKLIDINHPDYHYVKKVTMTYASGSLELTTIASSVFLSELPDFCNRYNVQNYAISLSDNNNEVVLKTLRSVGLPPNKLLGKLINKFVELGIHVPGNDYVNFLLNKFDFSVSEIDNLLSTKCDDKPLISTRWFLPESSFIVSINDLADGDDSIFNAVIRSCYYCHYRNWFDSGSDILTPDGVPTHISNHSVFEEIRDLPKDFNIHPSVALSDMIKDISRQQVSSLATFKPPEEFTTYLEIDPAIGHQLITGVDLHAEGFRMKHCIGGAYYRHKLMFGTALYFHLNTDSGGLTLEMQLTTYGEPDGCYRFKRDNPYIWWSVRQIYGRSNRTPTAEESIFVDNFLVTYFEKLSAGQLEKLRRSDEYITHHAALTPRINQGGYIDWSDLITPPGMRYTEREHVINMTLTGVADSLHDTSASLRAIQHVNNVRSLLENTSTTAENPTPVVEPAIKTEPSGWRKFFTSIFKF